LLYATAAKGFRPGGATGPIPTDSNTPLGAKCEENLQAAHETTEFVPSPVAYGPDEVWSYELGEKMEVFNERLVVNSAAYFSKWVGVQQFIPLPCGYNFTANAGDANIYGGEIEIHALLVPGLVLSGNAGYTHAALVTANLANVGVNTGTPVQQIPKWTSAVSLAYQRSISGQLAFTARVDYNYVGARTDATYTINQLSPYYLTNIRTGIKANKWSAIFFVNNVFNESFALNNVSEASINIPTYNRQTVNQPRTVGVDLNYFFGP
jgi:outer membrane receptor for ferric coprogen and ferric-rhodotorulic acid